MYIVENIGIFVLWNVKKDLLLGVKKNKNWKLIDYLVILGNSNKFKMIVKVKLFCKIV